MGAQLGGGVSDLSQTPQAAAGNSNLSEPPEWSQTIIVPLPPVAIDPDRVAEMALPVARAVADRTGAGITLLTVAEATSPFNPLTRMVERSTTAVEASSLVEAQRHLADVATTFPHDRVETVVRTGHAPDEISAVVADRPRPLLVLCSHTRMGLDHLLYGSVAGELVRTSPCPVLVVRGPGAAGAERMAPLDKIVAPLDGSAFAEHALDRALAALGPAGLQVHLVHVAEPSSAGEFASSDGEGIVAPAITHELERIAQSLRARGHHVTSEVRQGKPAEQIAQTATEQGADLIVMGTHGSGGFHPFLLGSVAERLLATSPVPVLLVRPVTTSPRPHKTEEAPEDVAPRLELPASSRALTERRAREVMVQPVVVAREETPLEDVAMVMAQSGLGCVPIVGERGDLVGIVTASDFTRATPGVPLTAFRSMRRPGEQGGQGGRAMTAGQIMSRPVTAVEEETPVGAVAGLLLERGFNQVPVVREGMPVGIVARRDLLRVFLAAGEQITEATNGGARAGSPPGGAGP